MARLPSIEQKIIAAQNALEIADKWAKMLGVLGGLWVLGGLKWSLRPTRNFDLALASFTHLCVHHELRLANNAAAFVGGIKWQNFHRKAK